MKRLSKSILYLFTLAAIGLFFAIADGSAPFIGLDFFPSAQGALQRSLNSSPLREVVSSINDEQESSTSGATSPAEVPREFTEATTDLGAELEQHPEQSSFGWHRPEERTELGSEDSFSKLAETLDTMTTLQFPPSEEPIYLGKNDEGLDQFTYLSEYGHEVVQWRNGDQVVVEEVTYPTGAKLVRRPVEFNGLSAETDMTHSDGSFSRLIYRANGEVEALHFAGSGDDAKEVLARYETGGRLSEYYIGPLNLAKPK